MSKNVKTESSIQTDMLIVLIVLSAIAVYYYGTRAFAVLALSSAVCIVTDVLCLKVRHKAVEKNDLSSLVTGLVIGLMMSAAVPYYVVVIADLFAVVIAKHAFGGHGHEIFNSAAAAFLFVSMCFSNAVLMYPKPFDHLALNSDTLSEAVLYQSMAKTVILTDATAGSVMDMLIGKFCGPMGTGFTVILMTAAAFLMIRRSISAISFCTQAAVIAVFTYIYNGFSFKYTLSVLSGGMFIFGIIFLSCDYRNIPKTKSSRLIYGIIVAVLTIVFRVYAEAENAIVYAVVIAAPLGIELDRKAISFAEILSKERSGIFSKLKRRFDKNLNHVDETLTLINGSDNVERSDKITIHKRSEPKDE